MKVLGFVGFTGLWDYRMDWVSQVEGSIRIRWIAGFIGLSGLLDKFGP